MIGTTEHPDDWGCPLPAPLRFLAGVGEATRLILERDWAAHPLGDPAQWPDALKVALGLILNSPESMILAWGPDELSFFFNETYFPLLGPRLSWAMGAPFAQDRALSRTQAELRTLNETLERRVEERTAERDRMGNT